MLKKIVLGTLLVGLIGILVTGAVIRTIDRTELVAKAQGRGRGNGEAGAYVAGSTGQGRGGYGDQGNGEAGSYAAGGVGRGRGGYGGQGREDMPAINSTGQAQGEEWLTIQGTVVSVDADTLVVQTVSGEQLMVENRAWWFAQEQGFSAQVGDQVTLVGFHEGDDPSRSPLTGSGQGSELHFEVSRIDDATNGQTVLVRDENGRPLWAGRGRRGG